MHMENRDSAGARRPNRVALRGIFLASLCWLGAAAVVGAQEAVDLSLEAALGRLDEVSEPVRVAAAAVDRARGEEAQARSGYFPQVGATAGYTRTLQSEFEALQDLGSEFQDLPFGQANRWDLGLSFSQS